MCSSAQTCSTFKGGMSGTSGPAGFSAGRPDIVWHNSTSTTRPASTPSSRPGSAGRSRLSRIGSAVTFSSALSQKRITQAVLKLGDSQSYGAEELRKDLTTSLQPPSNSSNIVEHHEPSRPASNGLMPSSEGPVGDTLESMGISSLVVAATLSRLSPGARVKDALHALCHEPDLPLDEPKDFWECPICFESQQTCGWQCPEGHHFCRSCMRHHVKAVTFPRCPQVKCGFDLDVTDLRLLKISRKRIEAFEHDKLQTAIETLGYDGSSGTRNAKVVYCRKDECSNVMLVPQSDCRECFACPCGAPSFCTQCGDTPYHFHADCKQVKDLRQRWLAWAGEARTSRITEAEAAAALKKRSLEEQDLKQRMLEEQQDEVWKINHCKLCPVCNRLVEKLDGCNSMKCGQDFHGGGKQAGCGSTFDWSEAPAYTGQAASRRIKPLLTNQAKGIYHPGINCKVCEKVIFGPRLRCIHCESFDACASCEAGLDRHDLSHVFEIIHKADFGWSTLVLPPGLTVRIVRSGHQLPPTWYGNQFEGKVGEVTEFTERPGGTATPAPTPAAFQPLGRPPPATYKVKITGHLGSDPQLPTEHLVPVFSSRWEAEQLLLGLWRKGQRELRPEVIDTEAFYALVAAEGAIVACRRLFNRC